MKWELSGHFGERQGDRAMRKNDGEIVKMDVNP